MIAVAEILWVFLLAWLVSALCPSHEMRRDSAGYGVYYSLWAFLFGSALLLQYRIVAHSGNFVPAVVIDLIGISLGAIRIWAIQRAVSQAPGKSVTFHP